MHVFAFPNPVNDKVARSVAAGVFTLGAVTLATGWYWLTLLLAAGFALRVAFGPRVSPLALLATRVIAPRLGPARYVPGPPKRFAQALGLAMTGAAAVLALGFDLTAASSVLLLVLLVAAGLEAFVGICIGCRLFAGLMRIGWIPRSICLSCANVSIEEPTTGRAQAAAGSSRIA
ncbi:MAG: hypothetical protein JWM25_752 [Thermoleophilia bacterium]|nr:hypothetical protein [Thermoleophilia bacterium]MCZ4496169.1 hypothetical protein [Thermoleophilia bacterium]